MATASSWGALEEDYPVIHNLPFLVFGKQQPSSVIFHFCRALHILSCVKLKGNTSTRTVESINELFTWCLHILIICVTISL